MIEKPIARRSFLSRAAKGIAYGGLCSGPSLAEASDESNIPQLWSQMQMQGRDGTPRYVGPNNQFAMLYSMWAYWCVNCVSEFPDIERLQASTMAGGQLGLGVILISLPGDWEKDLAYIDQNQIPFPVWQYMGNLSDSQFNAAIQQPNLASGGLNETLPTSILFSKGGTNYDFLQGRLDWSSSQTVGMVQEAINGS